MLRILQIGSGMPGWAGTEKSIIALTQGLIERGHQVTVGCSNGSILEKRCDALDIPRVTLQMRRTMDWRQLPKFVKAMRGNYDVVNIHSYRDYVIPPLAARLARIPAIVMTRRLPHPFKSRLRALACSCFFYDEIIAVSEFVRNVMIGSGVPPARITVVYNGIDPRVTLKNDHNIRDEFQIPEGQFLVGAAGRIEPQKGFDVLVRAMQNVQGHCIIFGQGVGYEPLRDFVRECGLESRVHLPGFREDVARLWRDVDVVVVPSATPETFCNVVLEAMSAGKPTIASRIGGIPEVLDAKCGILATPGDAQELSIALRELADSPERRHVMGSAGRVRASYFTLEKTVDGVERVYFRVLRRNDTAL